MIYILNNKRIFNKDVTILFQNWKIKRMNKINFYRCKGVLTHFALFVLGYEFRIKVHKIYKPVTKEELQWLRNKFKNGKEEFGEFHG